MASGEIPDVMHWQPSKVGANLKGMICMKLDSSTTFGKISHDVDTWYHVTNIKSTAMLRKVADAEQLKQVIIAADIATSDDKADVLLNRYYKHNLFNYNEVTFNVSRIISDADKQAIATQAEINQDDLWFCYDYIDEDNVVFIESAYVIPKFIPELYFKLNADAEALLSYMDQSQAKELIEQVAWEFLANTASVEFVDYK